MTAATAGGSPIDLIKLQRTGDAIRRLGPSWLAFRVRDFVGHRTGKIVRDTPRRAWQSEPQVRLGDFELADPNTLRPWLESHYGPDERAQLDARVDALRNRHFRIFGTSAALESWHFDPIHEVGYDSDVHWTDAGEQPDVDIKCVWEPSRFAWAYDLARAHVLDPTTNAAETFWGLFDDWLDHNPPNTGVNWRCGQESSIRLLAVTIASQAMPGTATDEQIARLTDFVVATADRVMAHIGYARSQNNNHLASEAMGLALAAALLPTHPRRAQWGETSEAALAYVDDHLVFGDGGTSQYSLNYHRVFMHDLTICALIEDRAQGNPRSTARRALARALRFLDAVYEPTSGSGPNFGHNDGADVLPLTSLAHDDYRPTVQLGRAVTGSSQVLGPGPWDESLAWFGLTHAAHAAPVGPHLRSAAPTITSFPDSGMHILAVGATRVYVRCGPLRYRPAHADQLNVDIWHDGKNVAVDRGTVAYTAPVDERDKFATSADHNTISLHDQDHMPRVGKFLWSRWNDGHVTATSEDDESVSITCTTTVTEAKAQLTRTVRVSANSVIVTDSVSATSDAPPPEWSTHWFLLAPEASALQLTAEPDDERTPGVSRAISYRQERHDVVRVRRLARGRESVESVFAIHDLAHHGDRR